MVLSLCLLSFFCNRIFYINTIYVVHYLKEIGDVIMCVHELVSV